MNKRFATQALLDRTDYGRQHLTLRTTDMNRSEQIEQLRPEISTDSGRESLPMETFQNQTLRPILKFQSDALIAWFKSQLQDADLPDFKLELDGFIKAKLQKDIPLRNALLGMVLGMMTEAEIKFYAENRNELNKRVLDMLHQRIREQMGNDMSKR